MLVIEEILDRIARRLGLPPEVVRERNLYHGSGETNTTHYGQEIEDNRIQTIWHALKASAEFDERRARDRGVERRASASQARPRDHAGEVRHLVHASRISTRPARSCSIYRDGTVQVNHGGTEMGQGLHTKIAAIAMRELGLPRERIRVMPTSTDKVPNTSATAASCGTDLNGAAVKNACETLRARLAPVAAELLAADELGAEPMPDDRLALRGRRDGLASTDRGDVRASFAEVVEAPTSRA